MGVTLQRVARFRHQVTGVAVSADGRRFVCFPRWTDDAPISVAELDRSSRPVPYPDDIWNGWRNATSATLSAKGRFVCVQAVTCDQHHRLWVVDAGAPGNDKVIADGPKIVGVDLDTNRVVAEHPVGPDVALQGSYLNDIRISPDGRRGYVTDSGSRGAIIVVDLVSGHSRRYLDGHPSTQPEPHLVVRVAGRPLLRRDGRRKVSASDGIALSVDGRTLYFQALTGRTLYAVPTALLVPEATDQERSRSVEAVADTAVADGLLMTRTGRMLLTSPSDASVREVTGHSTRVLLTDRRLSWPDTLAEGPGDLVYLTDSRIPRTVWYRRRAPDSLRTALYRFTLPAARPASDVRGMPMVDLSPP